MFTLGLDLDGVVADYTGEFRRFVSRYTGVPENRIPDPVTWNFSDSGWPISREDFMDYHCRAVQDGMFRSMNVMPNASQTLWWLAQQDVHIRVITHRLLRKGDHGIVVADTVRWLDSHNIPYNDLCFMGEKSAVGGVDVFIDDAPHNILSLRETNNTCVIFDAPYNQNLPGPRVKNWEEAQTYFEAFLNQKASPNEPNLPKDKGLVPLFGSG